MAEEEKKIALAVPFEWAIQKVLGPTFTDIGEDLRKLYAKGRDKIISAAYRKVRDPNDGKQANLRVTHDVLWNGAFTDEEVCAEYFGGILASSRTQDGKDDDVIQFVDTIKSLSAKQLRLHYVIYNSLNKLLLAANERVNLGMDTEINPKQVWFVTLQLLRDLGFRLDTDLNILHRQGLLHQYRTGNHKISETALLSFTSVNPTTFGVLLYAVAHNKLNEWRELDQTDFGDFPQIALPDTIASTLDELLKKLGVSGTILPR